MDIPRVIRMLEGRLKNAEGTLRFMISVQISQLEKAEKLRQLAMALASCVSDSKLSELVAFARTLSSFSVSARKLQKMRKALR
jgi:hypothetical protein